MDPQSANISTFVLQSKFFPKTIVVLDMLIHCPEAILYLLRIFSNFKVDDLLTLQKIRLSSVKRKWLIYGVLWHTLIPFKLLYKTANFKRLIKPSVQMRKRQEDRGSPCLKPWLGEIRHLGSLLTKIENVVDCIHNIRR